MRIAIADDNRDFLKIVEKLVKKCFFEEGSAAEICTFSDGSSLVSDIGKRGNYDIYLLDINMPDVNGLQAAEWIREQDENVYIVFVTAHEEYALQGYQYQAYQYVLKGQAEEKLSGILRDICMERAQKEQKFYTIANERKYARFLLEDILYLRKDKKYVTFYCTKNVRFDERGTLQDIFNRLPAGEFAYINRSEIVNLRHVTGVKGRIVELKDAALPVSRNMMDDLKKMLLRHWSGD